MLIKLTFLPIILSKLLLITDYQLPTSTTDLPTTDDQLQIDYVPCRHILGAYGLRFESDCSFRNDSKRKRRQGRRPNMRGSEIRSCVHSFIFCVYICNHGCQAMKTCRSDVLVLLLSFSATPFVHIHSHIHTNQFTFFHKLAVSYSQSQSQAHSHSASFTHPP